MADKLLEDVRKLTDEIASTLSPHRQVEHLDGRAAAINAAEQRRVKREAEERKQTASAETLRAEREFAVGQGIRNKFFAANPHATEADFARLWPKLRDEAMVRAMDQPGVSVEADRQNPRYNV